jgi:hypothetical protein
MEFNEIKGKKYCCESCKSKENIYLKRDLVPKKKRGRKVGQTRCKLLINLTEQDKQRLVELRPIK